jgi:hypothetical protein
VQWKWWSSSRRSRGLHPAAGRRNATRRRPYVQLRAPTSPRRSRGQKVNATGSAASGGSQHRMRSSNANGRFRQEHDQGRRTATRHRRVWTAIPTTATTATVAAANPGGGSDPPRARGPAGSVREASQVVRLAIPTPNWKNVTVRTPWPRTRPGDAPARRARHTEKEHEERRPGSDRVGGKAQILAASVLAYASATSPLALVVSATNAPGSRGDLEIGECRPREHEPDTNASASSA